MNSSQTALPQAQSGDPGIAVWSVFLRTHAAVVRVLEREVEDESGLPLSWYDVLLELDAADGGRLRMRELTERVVLSRTRVSRLVDEMAQAGMVDKSPDPADGRATFAVVTDRGRTALREAAPVYLRGIQEHFVRHLQPAELEAIRVGLQQVLAARSSGRRGAG